MKKVATFLTSLGFLAVGSLLLAQNTSSQTTAQSETKTESSTKSATGKKKAARSRTGSVIGEVTTYEEGKTITVKGPKGEKTVEIDSATKVTAKDIKEGSRVRVAWKESEGKEVAVRISGVKARKPAHKSPASSPKSSEPAPKTD